MTGLQNLDNPLSLSPETSEDMQLLEEWKTQLRTSSLYNDYATEIERFIADENLGLLHSIKVYNRSCELLLSTRDNENIECNMKALKDIAKFHDIGKFFQEIHTLDNTKIASTLYIKYSQGEVEDGYVAIVLDGIEYHDYYNEKIDPQLRAPTYLEGELIRAADKMLDNIVAKVDRYWAYGQERGVTFFDPSLTIDERMEFNFGPDFHGKVDELCYLLSILDLRPCDFKYDSIQQAYQAWAKENKPAVVSKIIDLAQTQECNTEQIKGIVKQYCNLRNIDI